jgi:hypothetical protein
MIPNGCSFSGRIMRKTESFRSNGLDARAIADSGGEMRGELE